MSSTEPDEVTIIVVAAKGIQGKKPGRHKYSVIFGVGNRKYRTCVVKDPDGCPEWNEESVIQVGNLLDQAFFVVTEKEDVIGQINIPVTSLQGPPGKQIKAPLQPHKKCPNPKGELIYQCFVSKFRPSLFPNASTPKRSVPNVYDKYRNGMTASPIMRQKQEKRKSALQTLNKKFSKSIHDLFSFARSPPQEEESDRNNSNSQTPFRSSSIGRGLNTVGRLPVIFTISPNEGTINGGTRVTIEGKNLGLSKADILELLICEVDHADFVEFESSSKIHVTRIKPSTVGRGDIILETESGGIGTLKNGFTYIDPSGDSNDIGSESNARFSIGDEEITKDEVVSSSPVTPKSPKLVKMNLTMPEPAVEETDGKSKKHFLKHIRRASEGHALVQSKGPVQALPVAQQDSIETLQAEIARLKKENEQVQALKDEIEVLKNDKHHMKAYIDKLVAKVITHCPEALANDEDDDFKSSIEWGKM